MATATRRTALQDETERICGRDREAYVRRAKGLEQRLARILDGAEGRKLTESESRETIDISDELHRLDNTSWGDLVPPFQRDGVARYLDTGEAVPYLSAEHARAGATFVDAAGNQVYCLSPSQRLTDLPAPSGQKVEPLSMGRLILGLATGDWRNAQAEKLSMGESWNASGGFMIGDAVSRTVIDYARNQAACVKAGALTMPWPSPSDTLRIARVTEDPTFAVVGENQEISEQGLSFGAMTFTANKLACLIGISRELLEDSLNGAALVESTLSKALACELDRLMLVGASPNGLAFYTDVEATGSIGSIEWASVHNAKIEVEDNNFTPNAYICSPATGGTLDLLQATDSGVWLGPPPSLSGISRFTSKNAGDDRLFMGQWDQAIFAVRTDALIEVTNSGGNAFAKHMTLIKLTIRCDVGFLNIKAFHVLNGIS